MATKRHATQELAPFFRNDIALLDIRDNAIKLVLGGRRGNAEPAEPPQQLSDGHGTGPHHEQSNAVVDGMPVAEDPERQAQEKNKERTQQGGLNRRLKR